MRLKIEHIKTMQVIHLIGDHVNESALIKSGVISESNINLLVEKGYVARKRNTGKKPTWLYLIGFNNPVGNALDNLNRSLVEFNIEL